MLSRIPSRPLLILWLWYRLLLSSVYESENSEAIGPCIRVSLLFGTYLLSLRWTLPVGRFQGFWWEAHSYWFLFHWLTIISGAGVSIHWEGLRSKTLGWWFREGASSPFSSLFQSRKSGLCQLPILGSFLVKPSDTQLNTLNHSELEWN